MIEKLKSIENIKNGRYSSIKKQFHGDFRMHSHEYYEIEFIISGTGTYTVDGKTYDVKPGMLFFMTPANFHTLDVCDCIMYNIMFSENMCDLKYLSSTVSADFPVALQLDEIDLQFFEAVANELSKEECDANYAFFLISTIIGKLCRFAKCDEKRALSPVAMAELYILNNFRNNISLNEVAEYVGFSPAYFSAVFGKETGKNFKEYTNELKYDYAKKLLEFTTLTGVEVCMESGFDEYTNFIRRFKQRFGMSPGQYRKSKSTK